MKNKIIASVLVLVTLVSSCKKFLDVVPDNVATIDNAFTMRSQAEKFLFTCYSYMPKDAEPGQNPAITGGDEYWRPINHADAMFPIARGLQNKVTPIGATWNGMYRALRDCNIFLENIDKVPDMSQEEKARWIGEVKALKAYYHFILVRMYGPVPLVRVNLPIDANTEETRVYREHVDTCFNYIVQLLDEAAATLPNEVETPSQLGRIIKPVAVSLKAKVLVTAASPLYNGNPEQIQVKGKDGMVLFDAAYKKEKWDRAVVAAREAIELCEQLGHALYTYNEANTLSPSMVTQLSNRNVITESFNTEIIWANTQSKSAYIQSISQAHLDPAGSSNTRVKDNLSPTLKIAELFYTKNGVPINEDKTWPYNTRYALRIGKDAEKLYMKPGYTSIELNFDREERYYANLGFDGGAWYGQGRYDQNNMWYVQAKFGQVQGKASEEFGSMTGFWPKKLVYFRNILDQNTYSQTLYPWPLIRLADLYLLYAEALNESEGPGPEAYKYINLVRERAGLPTVQESWTNYSVNPGKFTSKDGLREIIQQERLIEFSFEGQRFWDLRRWKTAPVEMNKALRSWNLRQKEPINYYVPITIINQSFGLKDYFWPIAENDIIVNPNLVQNPGW